MLPEGRVDTISPNGLELKKIELLKQKEELAILKNLNSYYVTITNLEYLENATAITNQESILKKNNIIQMEKRIKEIIEKLEKTDFLYIEDLKKKIEVLIDIKDNLNEEKTTFSNSKAKLEGKIDSIQSQNIPEIEGIINEYIKFKEENYSIEWINTIGEIKFVEEYEKNKDLVSIENRFRKIFEKSNEKLDRLKKELTVLKTTYNNDYKMSFNMNSDNNIDFNKELNHLKEFALPNYLEKILDSKEKAYTQFKDDFIAKLKSNIETVKLQVKELNNSLDKSVFGTDSYHFVVKANATYKKYYDMITDPLLMEAKDYNLMSDSFNDKYKNEISELFSQLILNETNVSAEQKQKYEENIRRFTDYKTYLIFDLIVTDQNGINQRLSKTLSTKSGGETQIPFYISLLASFSQVCRVNSKKSSNTIRLIILDEAFSKMDGERIQESINLLKKFKLQAIFSAPPARIPDITPYVDRNIAVFKDNNHSFTKVFYKNEIEDFE